MNNNSPSRHYLDWAATAIPEKEIQSETETAAAFYGNPSSAYKEGRLAKEALENARERCALVLGVEKSKLYFTSGGTESNAIVLHSLLLNKDKGKGRLLYSATEHPSVRENCKILEKLGLPTGIIGVETDGRVSANTLSSALEKYPDANFAAIMGVNNETGALMDIHGILSLLRLHQAKTKRAIHLHCDLVQALGKVPVEIDSLDSASFSAHKIGGQRGIGLLYLKKKIQPLYRGGEQEGGMRPGTENTLAALLMAKLLETLADPNTPAFSEKYQKAKERFKYLITELKKIKRCALIPHDRKEEDECFSPWIVQMRISGLPGAVAVRALDQEGIAVSTGSACSSASPERPVLAAMGVDEPGRLEGFRVSQGWSTEISDIDAFLKALEKVISYY